MSDFEDEEYDYIFKRKQSISTFIYNTNPSITTTNHPQSS